MTGTGDTDNGGAISGINVTPLVDVMLVLLVIFMVTAPMIQQGVSVELPAAQGGAVEGQGSALVVSITRDGYVYLNDTKLEVEVLVERLRAILEEKPGQVVYVRGDTQASYGVVVRVVAALKGGGVTKLGLITEPGAT